NQTNPAGEIVNETNTIFAHQNLTIRVNATGIGETINTVWIIIWETVASAGNILWQGLMSLIGGLWQVQVPVNESYPTYVNYTVFVNDSMNHTVQTEGNFIVNGISLTSCRELSQANTTYILASNVSSDSTCFNITAWNVTLDCMGYTIDFANSKTDDGYGFGVISYENDTTIKNCNISRDSSVGRYACGISLLNSSHSEVVNNTISTINDDDCAVYINESSTGNTIQYNNFTSSTGILFSDSSSSSGSDNDFTGNTFNCTTAIDITAASQQNNRFWLNNFYRGVINDNGANTLLCVNEEGNFYEEHLTPAAGDCGQTNITNPLNRTTIDKWFNKTINVAFKGQSSLNPITYYYRYTNISGTYDVGSTTALNINFSIFNKLLGENYIIEIIPNNGVYNGTHANVLFNTTIDNEYVCSDWQNTCEYTNITSALDGENNTANYITLAEPNATYAISKTAIYNITPYDEAVIVINANNATLDCNNSIIQGMNAGVGVSVESDNSTVRNCSLRNLTYGIAVLGKFTNITGNTFEHMGEYNILSYDSQNNNIWLNNFYDKGIIKVDNSKVISVDSTNHSNYGLSYPVTYQFSIPSGSSNLKAYRKYLASGPWTQIAEKTSSDIFNGIEAVRFNYTSNMAFVSVAFDSSSDNIYVEITDSNGLSQNISYLGVSKYYDNRSAAVVMTADDWSNNPYRSEVFINLSNITRNLNMWLSVGIITNFSVGGVVNWSAIQTELDKGLVEADSHSKHHDWTLLESYPTVEIEVNDSKEEIMANLDLPSIYKNGGKEYVWGWIEPFGYSGITRPYLGQYKYLADRSYTSKNSGVNYSDWDAVNGLYGITHVSLDLQDSTLKLSNGTFDNATSFGEIYSLVVHPYNTNLTDGSWERQHLQHISNRTNIWYAGLGQLYAYHYTGNITHIETSGSGTYDSFCVNNNGNFYKESLTPALGDCGQNNITYPANGTILSKDANTTTDVSWIQQSSQNSLNYSVY
ncbi:MAG: hypothetical protein NT001_04420, partial [Candidatus Woesearchaeota archaeon]|nr:hypothetical protein [Candidatus Woesearchaeota archaeon]